MHDADSATDHGPCSVLLHASESAGYQILQSKELPARAPKYLSVPSDLDRRLHSFLISRYPAGLYSHQTEAVQAGLARDATGDSFNSMVELLLNLTKTMKGRFLAFADSRRMVEQVVAATHRKGRGDDEEEEDDDDNLSATTRSTSEQPQIMPFRAGYEAEDRAAIQTALSRGRMVGVVSTRNLLKNARQV